MSDRSGHRTRKWIGGLTSREVLLALTLLLAASVQLVREAMRGWHLTDSWALLYQAATLGVNYPEFGAVRRGLIGTLIHVSGLPLIAGTVTFHIVGSLLLTALALELMRRTSLGGLAWWRAAGGLSLLFIGWGEDAGRADMTVAALVLLSTFFVVSGRPLAWALTMLLGLAVHENVALYGVPLAAVIWSCVTQARNRTSMRAALSAGCAVLMGLAIYLFAFDMLPHVAGADMHARIGDRLPTHPMVALGLYFGTTGNHGLLTAMCLNGRNPMHVLQVACGLIMVAAFAALVTGRDGRRWASAMAAALPSYLLLCLLANDTARWAQMACFNAWLVTVWTARSSRTLNPEGGGRRAVMVVCGLALLLVAAHPRKPLGVPVPVYSPLPLVEAVAMRFGVRPAAIDMAACEPDWHDGALVRGGVSGGAAP